MADEMSLGVYGTLVGVFLLVISLFVGFSTGSIVAVFVLWVLVAVIIMVLVYYEFIDIGITNQPAAPAVPTPVTPVAGGPKVGSEVFHIADNQFTYDEASAVCAAYGAQLATLEQVMESYNHGAEWCGYGWSAGGMALYPTQKATWTELQREIDPGKRTACGRPGVNGGYMEPSNKFGVNCFGHKPKGDFTPPSPLPTTDPDAFKRMVNKFKEMLKSMNVSPWSRGSWSGYSAQNYGAQFQQDLQSLAFKESFTEYADEFKESTATSASAYSAAPFGLKGDKGDVGPAGPIGPQGVPGQKGGLGPVGPPGAKGDRGLSGPIGPLGPEGRMGPKGDRGEQGSSGPQGPAGPASTKGDKGEMGLPGPKGDMGPQGLLGPQGPKGEQGQQGSSGLQGVKGDKGDKGDRGDIGPKAVIPKELTLDKLNLGDWSIFNSPKTATKASQLLIKHDGSARPVEIAGYGTANGGIQTSIWTGQVGTDRRGDWIG